MNPVAFSIFGFGIRYYSLFILGAVILSYILINKEAKKFDIDKDFIFNMFFWSIIIGIFGARLYYVLLSMDYYSGNFKEIFKIYNGGLAIHGGIIAGLITTYIYTKKHNFRFLRALDMIVPCLILSQSIGRWGNFFNSEAYGMAVSRDTLESLFIPKFIINGMHINGLYYFPTFFYESIFCFIGFIILYNFRKRKSTKIGQTTALYLIFYGIIRFFIEILRTDSLIFAGLKAAQLVSIIMIIAGIYLLIKSRKKSRRKDLYNNKNIGA